MKKISLNSILGGFNLSAINDRLKRIEDEFNDKVLYRVNPDGEPNHMQGNLDMNGYKIINVEGIELTPVEIPDLPQPASEFPQPVGVVPQIGTSVRYAREDHVHVSLAGPAGADGAPGHSNTTVYAYQRSATQPVGKPGNVVYNFTTAKIVEPAGNNLANGWTKYIPSGTEQLWVSVCSASSDQEQDTIAEAEWTDAVQLAANGSDGAAGLNTATVFIYQRTPTPAPPALPSATCTFDYNTRSLTGLNNGWTNTIPDVVYGTYLWISTATAASTSITDTIPATEWAAAQIMAQKGDAGQDGASGGLSNALVHAFKRSSTAPTDNPGTVTYSFTNGAITVPGTDALANGWSKLIPAGTDPLYVAVASATAYTATDTIDGTEWSAPVKYTQNGLSAMTLFLYKREVTETVPDVPSNTVVYDFVTKTFTTPPNNGWSAEVPNAALGNYLYVTNATASSDGDTDSIANTEWNTPTLFATSGVPGVSTATVYAYKRSATTPSGMPGIVTWDFTTGAITNPATDTLDNGWTKTMPAGTDTLYVTVATASSTESTDTIQDAEWSTPAVLSGKGLNVASIYAYQRNSTGVAPTKPSVDCTYTFSPASLSGLNNGWTATIPTSGGDYLWAITATAASTATTDTISSGEWATPALLARNGLNGSNGSNGSDGQRGTVQIAHAITGSTWSASAITTAFINADAYPPINRDVLTQYNTSAGYSETRFYDNGTWVALNSYINGNMLVTGTLSASKISADTMTGQIYQTASSFPKTIINETGSGGTIRSYSSGGYLVCEVGSQFSNGYISVWSRSSGIDDCINALQEANNTSIGAIRATNSSTGYGVSAHSSSGYGITASSNTGSAINISGGANGILQTGGGTNWLRIINPASDNAYSLGTSSSYAWTAVFAHSSAITTSDVRTKKDITNSDLGLSFINSLRPVKYKQIVGENIVTDNPDGTSTISPRAGTRFHYGLIAQEVKEAMHKHGVSDAAFWSLSNPQDPTSKQALRYEELIGPLIRAIQELSAEVEKLKTQ